MRNKVLNGINWFDWLYCLKEAPSPQSSALSPQPSSLSPHHSVLIPQSSSPSPQSSSLSSHPSVLITELLRTGMNICFQASGWSMHPSIKDGETITVEPVAPCDVKRGDIILYLSQRGVIAHRVVKIHSSSLSPHHLFLLRGDASNSCDEPVEPQQVLGIVVSVERQGHIIDLYSRKAKILHVVHSYVSNLKNFAKTILPRFTYYVQDTDGKYKSKCTRDRTC